MKYLILILTILYLVGCGKQAQLSPKNTEHIISQSQVFILFYDKSQTNTEKLITQGKKWNIELVYDYKNLNGLAIHIPNVNDVEEVKNFYTQTKGVLSIEQNQINQLH